MRGPRDPQCRRRGALKSCSPNQAKPLTQPGAMDQNNRARVDIRTHPVHGVRVRDLREPGSARTERRP